MTENCFKGKGDDLEQGSTCGLLLERVMKTVEWVCNDLRFSSLPGIGTVGAIFTDSRVSDGLKLSSFANVL